MLLYSGATMMLLDVTFSLCLVLPLSMWPSFSKPPRGGKMTISISTSPKTKQVLSTEDTLEPWIHSLYINMKSEGWGMKIFPQMKFMIPQPKDGENKCWWPNSDAIHYTLPVMPHHSRQMLLSLKPHLFIHMHTFSWIRMDIVFYFF